MGAYKPIIYTCAIAAFAKYGYDANNIVANTTDEDGFDMVVGDDSEELQVMHMLWESDIMRADVADAIGKDIAEHYKPARITMEDE